MPNPFGISVPRGIGREVYTGGPQRIASAAYKASQPDVNTLLAYAKLNEAKHKGIPDMGDVQKTAHYVSGLPPKEQSAWTSRYPALAGMIPKVGAVTPGMEVTTGVGGRTTKTMPGIREQDITSQIGKRTADITRGEAQTRLGRDQFGLAQFNAMMGVKRLEEEQRQTNLFNLLGAPLPADLSNVLPPGYRGLRIPKVNWDNLPGGGRADPIPEPPVPPKPPSPGRQLPSWR